MTVARSIGALWVAVLAALLGSLGVAPATAGPSLRTVSTRLSIAGSVFDHGAGEDVVLAGDLHLVTSASDGPSIDWHVNAGHIAGTGVSTGAPYLLVGTDAGSFQFPPGPPVGTARFEPTLTLLPPGPTHPPSPIRLLVAVSFGAGGRVTGVDVHLGTAPPTVDATR